MNTRLAITLLVGAWGKHPICVQATAKQTTSVPWLMPTSLAANKGSQLLRRPFGLRAAARALGLRVRWAGLTLLALLWPGLDFSRRLKGN
jgi:hypothetical protein